MVGSFHRERIFLLVEDDDDHAEVVNLAMKQNGMTHRLERVSDGCEAMAYLRGAAGHESALRPDVILLDLRMPRMSGHDVLLAIKNDPVLSAIPVVVFTTSAADSDRRRAYEAHANSYVVKPMEFGELREQMRTIEQYWVEINCPVN